MARAQRHKTAKTGGLKFIISPSKNFFLGSGGGGQLLPLPPSWLRLWELGNYNYSNQQYKFCYMTRHALTCWRQLALLRTTRWLSLSECLKTKLSYFLVLVFF
jgi:hypothetical protein